MTNQSGLGMDEYIPPKKTIKHDNNFFDMSYERLEKYFKQKETQAKKKQPEQELNIF